MSERAPYIYTQKRKFTFNFTIFHVHGAKKKKKELLQLMLFTSLMGPPSLKELPRVCSVMMATCLDMSVHCVLYH